MNQFQLNHQLFDKLVKGQAFALYALPGKDSDESVFLDNKEVKILKPQEVSEATGFIFAPYESADHPIFLFSEKERISSISESVNGGFFKNKNSAKIAEINQSQFEKSIINSQKMMTAGDLKKVVLSRPIKIENQDLTSHLGSLFEILCEWYPATLRYIVYTPSGQLWIGATPETLLSVKDSTKLNTMSLSGTKKANMNLPWTKKELDEHQWVVSYIESVLKKGGCTEVNKGKIKTIHAGPVEHLQTDFEARIHDKTLIADLIFNLHPTPAVCGYPLHKAKDFIFQSENYDRVYYTGFLGPVSKKRQNLFVNLRCLQLFHDKVVLYVGAGITPVSIPKMEWRETDLKSKTLLRAIEKIATFAPAKDS
ncbi:MAG: hypothetical protein EA362_09495 [Saprospirales bacterium]|nr:MAG: hypothetical protein EA362_09495 [Saprospirales bacterium]